MLAVMSVVDDYLAGVTGPEHDLLAHLYAVIRATAPDATEGLSYAMPAFKHIGKGLAAIMVNKRFLSLYPFCAVDRLGPDLSAFECTSGSVHFTVAAPIPDDLLREVVAARKALIEGR